MSFPKLGVNLDHVATLRQARGGKIPSPAFAAAQAQKGGADGITLHLREDRRHIQDFDLTEVRRATHLPLNLEMALDPEIVRIALRFRPEKVCVVPEKRRELTTEGGLDAVAKEPLLRRVIAKMRQKKIQVSLFIDPSPKQVMAARRAGARAIEIHTGAYANSPAGRRIRELQKIRRAARLAKSLGLHVHAGHGLDYKNVRAIARIPEIEELNIGHSIISHAVFVGMRQAVAEMKHKVLLRHPERSEGFQILRPLRGLRMTLASEIRKKWRPRRANTHKGDFGRVFILAGSRGLAGAAHLAGMGALRAGAGLVTVGVPEKIYDIVARREAEVMVKPFASTRAGSLALRAFSSIQRALRNQDVLALGPGLSQVPETQRLVRRIVTRSRIPVVLDADGLNAFKGHAEELKKVRGRAVLTPHPGECAQLFIGARHRCLAPMDAVRKKVTLEIARRFGIVIVLKGHRTVVAAPDGRVYRNSTGNPGMATAGTGDVLAGMLAALIGQGFSLWDASRFAVFFHGLAGDLAVKKIGQTSLVAGDLLNFLPPAFKKVLK